MAVMAKAVDRNRRGDPLSTVETKHVAVLNMQSADVWGIFG